MVRMKRNIKMILAICIVVAIVTTGMFYENSFEVYATTGLGVSVASPVEKQTVAGESSIKIMPFGDSITAGYNPKGEPSFGGYRNTLCQLLQDNGDSNKVDFVGKWKTGTGYDTDNSGTNGATITTYKKKDSDLGIFVHKGGLRSDVDTLMSTYKPDAVFLEIGTNDILNGIHLSKMKSGLEDLVNSIIERMTKDGALFMATVPYINASSTMVNQSYFTQKSIDTYVDNYNMFVRYLAGKKAAEGRKVYLVDINSTLSKGSDLVDGVHPTQQGYKKMGTLWYQTLQSYMAGTLAVAPMLDEPIDKPILTELNSNIQDSIGCRYKITKSDAQDGTAEFSGPQINAKGTITIPDTVMYKEISYSVTSIGANAFKGNVKVSKIIIGKNMVTINKNVFSGCKKLKTIIIDTTNLTDESVSVGAFDGLTQKASIKVPQSKLEDYKILFKNKGLSSKIKITAE